MMNALLFVFRQHLFPSGKPLHFDIIRGVSNIQCKSTDYTRSARSNERIKIRPMRILLSFHGPFKDFDNVLCMQQCSKNKIK